ncbi:MAG TPA: sigma-54-dependent Fis family transcriptional regulator [Rhodospirillaceae bacterium]|nr:sigma-54-dependent Fis family transcriptional regulator [Rhodospirillaceae bacterium]
MKLLIVGTLEGHIATAGRIATGRGAKVAHIDSIDGALNALRSGHGADLVMCDVIMDIAHLIESLKTERISVPVIACGIGTDASAAVRAIRAGAKEYVPLPPDAELIAAVLEAVAEEDLAFIAKDPIMQPILHLCERVAGSDASILVTGESGTGKEVIARFLHRKSKRARGNFVTVNCAAIPDNLLESELFGHEKGAFTGAIARRIGKFEEANGGTLLLDEISEMDARLQAKLLRAVQEREIDRLGGSSPIKINIRLIATSNRDLEEEVRTKRFREDLYFRLNVVNITMPPLRDRTTDIIPLAEHFAKKYALANGLPERPLTQGTQARLLTHFWRGNVRELENTMHRAILLAVGDQIEPESIMLTGQGLTPEGASPTSLTAQATSSKTDDSSDNTPLVGQTVANVERNLIIDTLQHCLGNRTHAANILGISIRTLRNKLKQYSTEGKIITPPSSSGTEAEQATS